MAVPSVRASIEIPLCNDINVEFISFNDLSDDGEHIALRFPSTEAAPVVRVHSECLTGDLFGSQRCDCGSQLDEAISRFSEEGGVLIYLRQEGRGIGLYNKLDAYKLQLEQGIDTFEANIALKHQADGRSFKVAAEILSALNINKIKLLSNNPEKKNEITANGIEVIECFSTGRYKTPHNENYLEAKQRIAGHLFDDSSEKR